MTPDEAQNAASGLRKQAADLLMEGALAACLMAAGRDAEVGGNYLWRLSGGLEGEWLLRLEPRQATIGRAAGAAPDTVDGTIDWQVDLQELPGFLRGNWPFAGDDERFRVEGRHKAKLRRALSAIANANVQEFLALPQSQLMGRFAKDDGKKHPPAGSVSLRPRKG